MSRAGPGVWPGLHDSGHCFERCDQKRTWCELPPTPAELPKRHDSGLRPADGTWPNIRSRQTASISRADGGPREGPAPRAIRQSFLRPCKKARPRLTVPGGLAAALPASASSFSLKPGSRAGGSCRSLRPASNTPGGISNLALSSLCGCGAIAKWTHSIASSFYVNLPEPEAPESVFLGLRERPGRHRALVTPETRRARLSSRMKPLGPPRASTARPFHSSPLV